MKTILYAFVFIVLITSCTEQIEYVDVEVPALHASEIYSNRAVKKYIVQYGDQHHAIAISYLEKAHAIKDKDLKKAIYFLKRSITLEPTAESYKELINVLSEDKKYSEACEAYYVLLVEANSEVNGGWVSEYVFSKPEEDLIVDYIVMSVLATNSLDYDILYMVGDDIDKQKIKDRLIADKRFNYDTSNSVHKNIMVQFWTPEEIETYKKSLANLTALLNSVADTTSVFEINQKNVSQFRYDDFNGRNYSEFYEGTLGMADMIVYYLKEKQDDPDLWVQYNINHSFHSSNNFKILVYAVDTSAIACPIEMREIYHRLVLYSGDGKIVSDKIIACQSGEYLQTVSFNKDQFEITEYKRNWRKPYKKYNFDNEIINIELLSKKSYTITASGDIVERIVQ